MYFLRKTHLNPKKYTAYKKRPKKGIKEYKNIDNGLVTDYHVTYFAYS